jgi:pyruvate,water dikinase
MPPIVPGPATSTVEEAVRTIEAELGVALGSQARVAAACAALRGAPHDWADRAGTACFERLATLIVGRTSPLVLPVFELLEHAAGSSRHPRALFGPMLRAGPPELVGRALDALLAAVSDRRLEVDDALIAELASIADAGGHPLTERASLEKLAPILGEVARLYAEASDMPTRRLAARALDLPGRPPAPRLARSLLGDPAYDVLAPYLDYTRATHLDLLAVASAPYGPSVVVGSLQDAERVCGTALLREVVATLGWEALNVGVEARSVVGVSIGGGLPLVLTPGQAAIFGECPGAVRVFERTLFVAHGARTEPGPTGGEADARVARFRAANLAHAGVLADFLDLAPLTRERAERLVAAVGALVADFVALFPGERDECRSVQRTYEAIAARIAEGARASGEGILPAEAARLALAFEDPASAADIRTLHGLKRYLHQRGLRLGLQLVSTARHATRTVSLAVADSGRLTQVARPIEYADFDPDVDSIGGGLPYAVRVVADAFGRQLLHGEAKLPSVKAFCYGNEVHYFIAFRNHPAFVRVDYSPPFAGGMVDLEYYGVSKYELSQHPNVSLDALRVFFRRLDFDIAVENTRVHARYDKERARDLADLCARAEALFRLAPYLMDLDWTVGGLDLPRESREAAAAAWADRFARWGTLPLGRILRGDRRAILLPDAAHPAGPRERVWRGDLPYQDRLTADPAIASEAAAWIGNLLRARGGDVPLAEQQADISQLALEGRLLTCLESTTGGNAREHEAAHFARMIGEGGRRLAEAAGLSRILAPLDRFLRFEEIGAVNGLPVRRAELRLPGRVVSIAVVSGGSGAPALALARDLSSGGRAVGSTEMSAFLRSHRFPVGDSMLAGEVDTRALQAELSTPWSVRHLPPVPGERVAPGVRAAPGNAWGLARLGTAHRAPRDLEGAVLVTDRLSPDDGPFLVRGAGVVCTGGGVLSHAGLIATQFGKPALIIDGSWSAPSAARADLRFWSIQYEQVAHSVGACEVVERRNVARREARLKEGDLVEVDADGSVLRVFGQDRETLSLHDALLQLETAEARLAEARDVDRLLSERGRRAHALHQLERLLARLSRADLAAFAVRRMLARPGPWRGYPRLLRVLLDGSAADTARACLDACCDGIAARYRDLERLARTRIPVAVDPYEIVALSMALAEAGDSLDGVRSVLQAIERGPGGDAVRTPPEGDLEAGRRAAKGAALSRLRRLHELAVADLERARKAGEWSRARRVLDSIDRSRQLIPECAGPVEESVVRALIGARDRDAASGAGARRVVTAEAGGVELQGVVGAKAANLSEAALLCPDAAVPGWFAVTHAAFEEALAAPANDSTHASVRAAIDDVLSLPSADERQRSQAIAAVWDRMVWPADLEAGVRSAYRRLAAGAAGDPAAPRDENGNPFVAVRSSAFEEDRPEATRAGEFDTFLFVAGEDAVLAHVARAWSGLWTARSLRARAALGAGAWPAGGGVLVQRMVDARAAGVVQTINVADARPWELVIDVSFGLGEGVVSGRVAADHVVVVKDWARRGALRFQYATADKRERVVFDRSRGAGTIRADTLYHQRMRPALAYLELESLVGIAERLEQAWREALNIEFAFDAHQLWILQVRPVPAFHAAWREIARRWPAAGRRNDP